MKWLLLTLYVWVWTSFAFRLQNKLLFSKHSPIKQHAFPSRTSHTSLFTLRKLRVKKKGKYNSNTLKAMTMFDAIFRWEIYPNRFDRKVLSEPRRFSKGHWRLKEKSKNQRRRTRFGMAKISLIASQRLRCSNQKLKKKFISSKGQVQFLLK